MKSKKLWIGIPVITLVFGIMFGGCTEPEEPATYTVLIGKFTFTEDGLFGSMRDGYYSRQELTKAGYDWHKQNNFYDTPEYEWTEDQLYSYLIGLGFDDSHAKKESEWLVTIEHGIIGLRRGTILYIIFK